MSKRTITWREFRNLVKKLEQKIIESGKWKSIKDVYGIPRGGQYVALMFSEISKIPLTNEITKSTLVIDDICDSGTTLAKYTDKGLCTATLFFKPHSTIKPHFFVEETKDWVVFPWEQAKSETVEDNVRRILELIGENPNRKGLIDTPKRVAKMYSQLFFGYDKDKKPGITTFP
ncbi:unnamed protein product, partial [marine sediment metagenome]